MIINTPNLDYIKGNKKWLEKLYQFLAQGYQNASNGKWLNDKYLCISKDEKISWQDDYDMNRDRYALRFELVDFDYPIMDRFYELIDVLKRANTNSTAIIDI